MQIYLVRHAIAAPREAGFVDDAARELTPEGIKKMRRIVAALDALGVRLDEIWTSPLVRAHQTAELLAAGLGDRTPIKTVTALEPGGDFEILRNRISQHRSLNAIALVGHEPAMGEFTSYLMGGPRSTSIRFKKGGVALVEIDGFSLPLRGELCWLLTPKQMALIAESD